MISKWITIEADDPSTWPKQDEIVLWKFPKGSDIYGKVYAGFMRTTCDSNRLLGKVPAIMLFVDCTPGGKFTEYVFGAEKWRPMIGVDE